MTDDTMLSQNSNMLLSKLRKMVPPMLDKFHKGQMGRIAVIGGSQDYTGAPYFSANASALLGADLSYIICEPHAASVIKTYSPNLMVSPFLRQSNLSYPSDSSPPTAKAVADSIIPMLSRLHVLVVGPGLGRDKLMLDSVKEVLKEARTRKMGVVIDADALSLVNEDNEIVRGWKEVVLTPNVVEFSRLAKSLDISISSSSSSDGGGDAKDDVCERVAKALGNVTILQKGVKDTLSNGEITWTCDLTGGKKRSGGQGDTLTGSIGTFLCWRHAYLENLWDREDSSGGKEELKEEELIMLAAWGGAAITRECSRLAFQEKGRALQASDVGGKVPEAFLRLVGERDEDGEKKGEGSKL